MRYVILGTAGHIDHGKSQLVRALTGIDPDRLKEEKERGITIDLGFADLEYPDGLVIGIVDVPGHERLIKNMLAGAGGIDMVMMVIAADEGIMPQSREHLHICNLLRIKSGLVALTKTDLVEPDWLELVQEEAREFVRGTFLEGAPIVPVSSKTGEGIGALKEAIRERALLTEPKPSKGLFRLPVDRVFTLKGFGTVVTGTALSGTAGVDEAVSILPGGISTRIRGLHSHGKAVERVTAGQRAALNLQGIEKEDLQRGDTIVTSGRFRPTMNIDASVELLPGAHELKSRDLVHFHLGTSETVARVILYGREKLPPGEGCYCQLRLKAPVIAQCGDRFVLRRFSPLQTIGGGTVLDPLPVRRRKKDGLDDLDAYEKAPLRDKIAARVLRSGLKGMAQADVEGWVRAEVPAIKAALGSLRTEGRVIRFEDLLIHSDAFAKFASDAVAGLRDFHLKNPLKHGMPKEELRARMKVEPRLFAGLISMVEDAVQEKDLLRLKGFSSALSDEEGRRIAAIFEKKGFQPPSVAEAAAELGLKERQVGDILKLLDKQGKLKRLNDATFVSPGAYEEMIRRLREHFAAKDEMTVAEFRDMLGTTRKYALPFLEYLDSNRMTLRVGEIRKSLLK